MLERIVRNFLVRPAIAVVMLSSGAANLSATSLNFPETPKVATMVNGQSEVRQAYSIDELLSPVKNSVATVWSYNKGSWNLWSPDEDVPSSLRATMLDSIELGKGYVVVARERVALPNSGFVLRQGVNAVSGYGLVKGLGGKDVASRLAVIREIKTSQVGNVAAISGEPLGGPFTGTEVRYKTFSADGKLQDLEVIDPRRAYFILPNFGDNLSFVDIPGTNAITGLVAISGFYEELNFVPGNLLIPSSLPSVGFGFRDYINGVSFASPPGILVGRGSEHGLVDSNEFDFGVVPYLVFGIKLNNVPPESFGVIIEYIPPDGSKFVLTNTGNEPKNSNENTGFFPYSIALEELLGTFEHGKHTINARITTSFSESHVSDNFASVSFTVNPPPPSPKPLYTRAEWTHFEEVAFGFENEQDYRIHKWNASSQVRIYAYGSPSNQTIKPSKESMQTLENLVEEITKLTHLDIKFTNNPQDANLHFYLDISHSELPLVFPHIPEETLNNEIGYYYLLFNSNGVILTSSIAVPADDPATGKRINQSQIGALIAHEFLHALGLTNHARTYQFSDLRRGYSTLKENSSLLLPIDRRALKLLYESVMAPGFTPEQARQNIIILE